VTIPTGYEVLHIYSFLTNPLEWKMDMILGPYNVRGSGAQIKLNWN
jgi:hypothetical protein